MMERKIKHQDAADSLLRQEAYGFGNLDGDRDVDINDVMLVASRWQTSCYHLDPDNNLDTPNYEGRYDLDHDCDIDVVDIMLVVKHWGESCG